MAGTTAWILGDQLTTDHPGLDGVDRVVMVESTGRATGRRRYHRRKLTLIFSAMRHFAAELDGAGFEVDYRYAGDTTAALQAHVAEYRPDRIVTMEASEWSGRRFQRRLGDILGIPARIERNSMFLVAQHDPYPDVAPTEPVVMEHFYRSMRRHFGLLVDGAGEPIGGRWNFDADNRAPYPRAGLQPPAPRRFDPDAITRDVMTKVASLDGIGDVDGFDLPVTRTDAVAALEDFIAHRFADFGRYEDAMSRDHPLLFHSLLSPALNLGLLEPLATCRRAERALVAGAAPINSVEGFVRQILGWREFIYWNYGRLMPDLLTANAWDHHRTLPAFWWDGDTDMACLRTVIERVLHDGYSHHIERLMVLCNFAMLAGVDPARVNEWFLSCYVDAFEWVVTPNVIGMGLNADGGITATKPYVASANYINKMSDHCGGCRYDPKQRTGPGACPYNALYWDFLIRNEQRLRSNPRSGKAVLGLRHLDQDQRRAVAADASAFLDGLAWDATDDADRWGAG